MKIIQTLYIDNQKDILNDTFGWKRPEYHLMSWALSCLQIKEIYGNISLYANSKGAELLIDLLQLPYSGVDTSLDNLTLPDINLWALPKIYTYSIQETPFLHIDGDVFLFDKLPERIFTAELAAQNMEVATEYYTSTQRMLMEYFTFFPDCVEKDFLSNKPIHAVNAGILGGNDIDFIKEYTSKAFEYINNNINQLENINADRFNVFFEQHLFHSLAKERNKTIQYLFNDVFEDRGYLYLGNFHEVTFKRTYLHLLGHLKRDEITCIQMANKLRELYPDYYYRILSIFKKKNIPIFTPFYNEKNITSEKGYNKLLDDCKKSFINHSKKSEKISLGEVIDKEALNSIFDTFVNLNDKIINNDLRIFINNVSELLQRDSILSDEYFYGRDIFATNWYKEVFEDEHNVQNVKLCKATGSHIVDSLYDWGGLFNKYYRAGIPYYEDLNVEKGEFYNLIVYELFEFGLMIYDIDDVDKSIYELLEKSLTIKEILSSMEMYFEEDVIENHYEEFKNLIIESIKHLVLYKAIQPVNLKK